MANVKISDLTAAASVAGTNELEINEAGTSKKVTASQVLTYVKANTTAADIGAQASDAQLTDIAGLTPTDNGVIIGNGTNFVVESGATLKTSLGLTIGTDVQAYDIDTLKADTADVLTAGFAGTVYDAGTKSSGTFTLNEANGNLQKCVNGGAFILAPSTNSTSIVLQVTNNASAGAVTTSGWTKVTGSFTTTDGDDFMCYCTVVDTFSHLHIQALQ